MSLVLIFGIKLKHKHEVKNLMLCLHVCEDLAVAHKLQAFTNAHAMFTRLRGYGSRSQTRNACARFF